MKNVWMLTHEWKKKKNLVYFFLPYSNCHTYYLNRSFALEPESKRDGLSPAIAYASPLPALDAITL